MPATTGPQGAARFCVACGKPLRAGAVFCTSCGHRVAAQSSQDPDATRIKSAAAGGVVGEVDRFQIKAVLAQGQRGPVFRAFDPDLGRLVALRQLSEELATDPQWYARARGAAARMAGISDEHCVEIYNLLTDMAPPVLLSEYVPGPSLDKAVAALGPLPAEAALATLDGALEGLEHVHSLGLTHGSLTPSCVLLDEVGVSKLTDVGLGYGTAVPAHARAYLAPEVLTGAEPAVTADVYSAAALMAFSFTGATPAPDALERLHPNLRAVVADGMKPQAAARPGGVAELRRRIAEAAASVYGPSWRQAGAARMAELAANGWLGLVVADSATAATAVYAASKAASLATIVRPEPVAAASTTASSAAPGATAVSASSAAASGISATAKVLIAAGTAFTIVVVGGGAVVYTASKNNPSRTTTSYSTPTPSHAYEDPSSSYDYSTPEPTTEFEAMVATGEWYGDWNRSATGESFTFTLDLDEASDGSVTGVLVGQDTNAAGPMSYNVVGGWEGGALILDGVSWNNKTRGAFLDHMVFTDIGESRMDGTYAAASAPNAVRGTISAIRS